MSIDFCQCGRAALTAAGTCGRWECPAAPPLVSDLQAKVESLERELAEAASYTEALESLTDFVRAQTVEAVARAQTAEAALQSVVEKSRRVVGDLIAELMNPDVVIARMALSDKPLDAAVELCRELDGARVKGSSSAVGAARSLTAHADQERGIPDGGET